MTEPHRKNIFLYDLKSCREYAIDQSDRPGLSRIYLFSDDPRDMQFNPRGERILAIDDESLTFSQGIEASDAGWAFTTGYTIKAHLYVLDYDGVSAKVAVLPISFYTFGNIYNAPENGYISCSLTDTSKKELQKHGIESYLSLRLAVPEWMQSKVSNDTIRALPFDLVSTLKIDASCAREKMALRDAPVAPSDPLWVEKGNPPSFSKPFNVVAPAVARPRKTSRRFHF